MCTHYSCFLLDIFVKAAQDLNIQGTLLHRLFFGPNMAFLNGSAWKHQRMVRELSAAQCKLLTGHFKVANPAFHRSFPIDLFGSLAVKLFEIIDAQGSPTTDVYDMMERYGLDVIGKAAFGKYKRLWECEIIIFYYII